MSHYSAPKGGGGTCSIHDGGADGASYCKLKKNTQARNLTPHTYLAMVPQFPAERIQDLNTSILIYSIKDLKKNVTNLLTQKNTKGVNFQPPKNTSDLPLMYTCTTSTPLGSSDQLTNTKATMSTFFPSHLITWGLTVHKLL